VNVYASEGRLRGVLGLLILHTPLVKVDMKMKVSEREKGCMCECVCVCVCEAGGVKGEAPCLILWDVRVSTMYGDRM